MPEKQQYITLKEAAKISGYAPDYVGQLIRSGKLKGKQIYQKVAWVTTEEDLKEYLENKKAQNGDGGTKGEAARKTKELIDKAKSEMKMIIIARAALYAVIAAAVFSIAIFYIMSVSLEKKLERSALQEIPEIQLPPIDDANRIGL